MTLSEHYPKEQAKVIEGGNVCANCAKAGNDCCRGCGGSSGYFYQSLHVPDLKRFTIEELELIAAVRKAGHVYRGISTDHPIYKLGKLLGVEFDPKAGFGGPTGCRLPREKRSRTCLRYFCPTLATAKGINANTTWWAQVTEEEIAADKEIFGDSFQDFSDPVSKFIEFLKGKKDLAPTT